jgi:hypothetical protein
MAMVRQTWLSGVRLMQAGISHCVEWKEARPHMWCHCAKRAISQSVPAASETLLKTSSRASRATLGARLFF